MKIKLIINGNDHRVRLEPEDGFDEKLLLLLEEKDGADLSIQKDIYSRDIKSIDLVLKVNPVDPHK